jgi:ribosomal protein S18 acetylase RimI-like enzyme
VTRSNVHIRPAELGDVASLVSVAETADLARGTMTRGTMTSRPLSVETRPQFEQRFATIITDRERSIFVAVDDASGDVVGFVAARDDDLATITHTPVLHISHLIVMPKFRKRGVARSLLAAIVMLADERGIDHVLATAGTGARDANRYLARLGFAPLVIRRVAPTSVLRRSLGMAETPDKLAIARRIRAGRSPRPARLHVANGTLSRGA